MTKTLLILAAGLSSRYGSLKQLETFGPNGELLMEYGIYDAIEAGFTKLVFVIKQDIADVFMSLIDELNLDSIEIHFVFQETNDLPSGFNNDHKRKKPWGTAHAIWSAREKIKEPFLTINADDFYGKNAFKVASNFFEINAKDYAVISYKLGDTLSAYGGVNRGICFTDKTTNNLMKIVEVKDIKHHINNNLVYQTPEEIHKKLTPEELVSMNMFCLRPSFFPLIENLLKEFSQMPLSLPNDELLIPHVIDHSIRNTTTNTIVIDSNSDWFGVTYKEDRIMAIYKIEKKIKCRCYPEKLFAKVKERNLR